MSGAVARGFHGGSFCRLRLTGQRGGRAVRRRRDSGNGDRDSGGSLRQRPREEAEAESVLQAEPVAETEEESDETESCTSFDGLPDVQTEPVPAEEIGQLVSFYQEYSEKAVLMSVSGKAAAVLADGAEGNAEVSFAADMDDVVARAESDGSEEPVPVGVWLTTADGKAWHFGGGLFYSLEKWK